MAIDAPSDPRSGVPYYLLNFERALAWLAERYDDLLDAHEHGFLRDFAALPQPSRALLVRMLMRKGTLFRASRLSYDEIGCPLQAVAPLAMLGWVDTEPVLTLDDLFALTTRPELLLILADAIALIPGAKGLRKPDLLETLRPFYESEGAGEGECDERGATAQPLSAWHAQTTDRVFHVAIAPLCERLRLMFFGNLQQDWSEFVLADLGVFQYEKVAFAPSSRAFQQREDVDVYLALHACREALEWLPAGDAESEAIDELVVAIAAIETSNPWLETRRAKLLFRIGQHCERQQNWRAALAVYERCAWPGARHRRLRVLERSERFDEAFALALQAAAKPESEEEAQRIERMLLRLQRKRGERVARVAAARPVERSTLVLPRPDAPQPVEYVARDHLTCDAAPVHYVENALINSLFGLLCWEPVFAALPGAFFHPFQRRPADLHAPDFHARRAAQFAACLAQLDSSAYRETILRHLQSKAGLQSPFVFWGLLTQELVELALDCLPAAHLKLWFERLLRDIRGNRSGLPDLIRFWPAERRYELIEVKGPGDRLQDNQIRWLAYCAQHGMPVRVLDVRWADEEIVASEVVTEITP
ncbi:MULTISPECIES: VRR-NUC domain-containing protein [Paraburkholderia]|uniref:VRR-NUC domain-containing protein n=1 Tax=Paraburkholderia TaxID=1822464 RepID=UPI001B2F40EE|nr:MULTISPECIES: VRR-NUC domain-containing protein [Paraburkholderia]MCX4139777.1 VRR-NUC domain-containing protein [Paraburkholderia aspalathi]MCX4154739.1 VRR-NUC domain-containing protein [Paraburkholderia aspalathi]MDN7164151.1 VRR-NUC domain-containing protein [Paraburkholderia sp. SECH2]MDN7172464.1 VRR-NUC domain-containing protein [Paraburkholderia sp. SEWSISQ10-3 4]MDQ6392636.1 VRR-NUC domain-containing protein [Paraburkholderia aspalathi]